MSRTAPGKYVPPTAFEVVVGFRLKSQVTADGALAVIALAGSLVFLSHGGIGPSRPTSGELDLVGVVLTACSTLPLVAWRRSPLGVFVLTTVASVMMVALGYRVDLLLGPGVALYLLAASRQPDGPWGWRSTATVLVLFFVYLLAAAAAQGTFPVSELLHTGLAWCVAWFAGERTRLRREQIAELRARALRAEEEALRERRLAVAEERARIARDLHDSAGHAINVIAIRAGAARLRHHDSPERSLAALEAIEDLARQTAAEIDQFVGVLRDSSQPNGSIEAPVGLASLNTLIGRHREAGLEVSLHTSGAQRPLAAPTDQAVYRIVQEALTNAARHGAGHARVELMYTEEAVELTVANRLPTRHAPSTAGGHGLIGMRERAALLGGTLFADREDGGFRVHARLPYGAPAV
jgi:signal transduction histidine kinase